MPFESRGGVATKCTTPLWPRSVLKGARGGRRERRSTPREEGELLPPVRRTSITIWSRSTGGTRLLKSAGAGSCCPPPRPIACCAGAAAAAPAPDGPVPPESGFFVTLLRFTSIALPSPPQRLPGSSLLLVTDELACSSSVKRSKLS